MSDKAELCEQECEKMRIKMLALEEDVFYSREKLNLAMELSKSALWEYDVLADKTVVGDSFYKVIGCKDGEASLEIFNKAINIEDRLKIRILLAEMVDGKRLELEALCRFRDMLGDERLVQLHGRVAEKDNSGRPVRIFGMGTDITERVKLEEELRAEKEKAEKDNILKTMFIDNMSHELRTPMNAIMGFTDVALETELDEEQTEYLQFIKKASDDLLDIIEEILAFSEMQSGGLKNVVVPCSMLDIMHKVVFEFKEKIIDKGLMFYCKYVSSFPVAVIADSIKIERILNILVSNAIKFTKDGSVTIGLYVDGKKQVQGDKVFLPVRITVEDTGIGIPTDKLSNIFESFAQVDASSTRAYGGIGLGLTTAKGYAKIIGGDVTVKSTLGKGSCFTLKMLIEVMRAANLQERGFETLSGLRVICVNESEKEEGKELLQQSITEFEDAKYRALVVEDNKLMFQTAKAYLAQYGIRAIPAYSGQEALDKMERDSFDIIFMDIYMPEMDGYETTVRIREREKSENRVRTPVVALSAEAMMSAKQKAVEVGMDAYISKPLRRSDIELVLNTYIFDKE